MVKLVLGVTIYFMEGHSPATRKALRQCFDDYFSAFGEHLRWGFEPHTADHPVPRTYDKNLVDATTAAFDIASANEPFFLSFSDSFNPDYVGDYGITCLTIPRFQDAQGYNSYLNFTVPCDSYQNGNWNGGSFPVHDFLVNCCKRLKAAQGYAGFSLALPHEYPRWEPYELKEAQKYYGLEIDKPTNTVLMIDEWRGIKDVNWYTILGQPYVEKLGGIGAIKAKLSASEFGLYDYGSGVAIRAGGEPVMAPVATGLPPFYVAVNNVVRDVRTTQIRSMGFGSNAGELRFNLRLTDLWMRRFDAPGIWPPAQP